jgi:tetratricopeptide (TPR) repeat protein
VALICELSGRITEANRHYGKAFVSHWPELLYFPYQGFGSNPLIHDLPDPRVPFWTSWHEHLVAGSLFSYAARQIDNTYYTDDPEQLTALRRRAVQALDVCVRRGIRVAESRALRGWVLFDLGETDAALDDLRSAQQAFVEEGTGDATTSLLLGTHALRNGDAAGAIPDLQDAVRLDPDYGTAWRTYGVALATLRRFHEAEAAMDRALEIDPYAAGGWHNRGLMNMNLQRWREAYADLAVASRLMPGNPETEQMLALARRNWLKESGETGRGPADARADSLAAALRSGEPLLAWPARPVNLTPRAVRISDIDHAACADSLGYLFAEAPDDTLRLRLAEESLLAGRPNTTLDLLAAEWRAGLTLVEQHLVLQADRALGLHARARELAEALLSGDPVCADAPLWSLVAACCLDGGLRDEGLAALDRAVFLDPGNHALKSFRKLVGRQVGP